jgi:tetratricopeptide (TPR) repeat protein
VVGRRLERLGAEAQKVLAAGAVVGRGFPFALLEAITDVDADRLLDIVEAAEAAKVIVPEPRGGDVHYSFAHELIRQTLLSGLSLLRRQRLHLAIADAIERTDKTAAATRPSEIANHLLQAGAGADAERTLGYLERTADRAMDAAAFEEALRAIDDALSLVDDDDRGRRAKLLERKGWTVRALGDFEECIAIWNDVLPIYEQMGEVDAAAWLCWETGYQFTWLSRFAEAFAAYARGAELFAGRRSPIGATLVAATGSLLGLGGSYDAAEAQFADAIAAAEEIGDDRALGRIGWGRTMSNWSNARLGAAIESGRAAIEHLRRAQDLWTLVDALAWTSYPLSSGGAPGEARVLAEEAVEIAVKIGHLGGEFLARRGVALAAILEDADLEQNELAARADLVRFESIRSPWVSQSHTWIATNLMLRGDLEGSLSFAEKSIELEPPSAWTGIGWAAKFVNRAMAGEVETCRELLAQQRTLLPDPGETAPTGRIMMLYAAAKGCVIVGLAEEAAALYPLVNARVDAMPIGNLFDMTLAHRIAGMAATAAGLWDEAQAHFEAAARQAREYPNRVDAPQVLHWHAKMLLERGKADDRVQAQAMLAEALDGYRELGMPLHIATVEEMLG